MSQIPRFVKFGLLGFAALLFAALVLLMREAREPAPRTTAGREGATGEIAPLTSVAAAPRPPELFPFPMESYEASGSPDRPAGVELPVKRPAIPAGERGGETAGPGAPAPQWTQPLAVPGQPRPPSPFREPAIAQDPERGRLIAGS